MWDWEENDPVAYKRYQRSLKAAVKEICTVAKEAFGWSPDDLAIEAGIAPSTLSKISSGATRFPYYATLIKLATAVGFTQIQIDKDHKKEVIKLVSRLDEAA